MYQKVFIIVLQRKILLCHSERSEESWFLRNLKRQDSSPTAQNDKQGAFLRCSSTKEPISLTCLKPPL